MFSSLGGDSLTSKGSTSSEQPIDSVAAAKERGKGLRQMLSKTQKALTHLHEVMLPGKDTPESLECLADVFSANDAAIKGFSYLQTERGARSLISVAMAHGAQVDFNAITSSFPVGPDGRAVSTKKFTRQARQYASQFSKLIEAREAKKAKDAAKKAKAAASESEFS